MPGSCNSIKGPKLKIAELLDEAADVLHNGTGNLNHVKVKIVLEVRILEFCKARSVPFAVLPKVETQLQHLRDSGIISKVNWSKWSTSIVPVMKKSGLFVAVVIQGYHSRLPLTSGLCLD